MKTFRQLHDMTDKHLGVPKNRGNRAKVFKLIDGAKWHEIFEYLNWKYNTSKKQKEAEWDINKKKLGL